MSDRVLITGGLGYVGGRVARHLARAGRCELHLASRRPVDAPAWLERGRIVALDVTDELSLAAACEGVNQIVHFAAINEIDSAADPEQALVVNGLGTLKVLRAAIRAGVERFVYFSTAHVYGSPLAGRLDESTLARPQHPYAITHRVAEDFVLAARDKGEIAGVVLRLSNGFGAPERADVNRWTLLVNDLCRQAVVDRKLVLKSSGVQLRDFITLEDVGRAVEHVLELDAADLDDGLFNLGGGAAMSILEVAKRIAARCEVVLGFTPELQHPERKDGEVTLPLDFRIDKLARTGFALTSDIDGEIDATLRLCRQAFGDGA
jgi:UDP-glucose 4-epimerase